MNELTIKNIVTNKENKNHYLCMRIRQIMFSFFFMFFVITINICAFAAVVSDNDGSAFITKAEFDSLNNAFQSQLNQFNTQIDSKIDTAIAGYLSGVKAGRTDMLTNNLETLQKNYNVYWSGQTNGLATTRVPYGTEWQINIGGRGSAYGNSNINIGTSTQYADLGEWDYLTIVVASDNPRLFFNQNDVADQGGNILVPVTDANYVVSNENGVIVYDLAKFKADKGFVHLNAIKASAYNTQVNITEMKLATVEPYKPVATAIEGVENAEDAVKDGKYFINGQIVIVKNGVKYNAAGVAIK